MGTLRRFHFSPELVERFPVFVETGTGHGSAIRYAQSFGFDRILSVDSEREVVDRAQNLLCDDPRVAIYCNDSTTFLRALLDSPSLRDVGVVFWLDAHFPGSDVLGAPYESEEDLDRRLPLLQELELIESLHPDAIVVVDDLRFYVQGPFASGNVGSDHVGLTVAERHEAAVRLYDYLKETHYTISYYDETGYLVFIPHGAVGPTHVEFTGREHCEMARADLEVGDADGAAACYRRVIELTDPPDTGWKRVARGEACRFFAADAHDRMSAGVELDWYNRALHADPLCVEYRMDLVNLVLLPLRWMEAARQEASKAIKIAPDEPRAWQTAANVECEADDAEAAMRYIAKGLEVGPENAGSHLIAGKLAADLGRWEEALGHYAVVLALPHAAHRRAETLQGMAIVRDRQGRTEEALELIERALALDGGDRTLMRWNRAEMLLTLGRYEEGWREHSVRFDQRTYRGGHFLGIGQLEGRFTTPLWSVDDPPCRVHVHPEMGFGDVICMARYVPLLRDMGHDVRFEVKSHFVKLFTDSLSGVKVHEFAIDYPGALGLEVFDRHINVMRFPKAFGTTIDTVPWSGPYIRADQNLVGAWRLRLPSLRGRGLKVGLCWSAGIRPGMWYGEYGRRKSAPFAALAPLLDLDATFVSLQGGKERLENKVLPGLTEDAPDWSETAALIECLDLVVTVDTSVAHLAGAMGKLTWLMMHVGGSWHWMRERLDSPWYPSIRIFRQERPHEWGGVVDRIRRELQALCDERAD